jgi:hypothetical protein
LLGRKDRRRNRARLIEAGFSAVIKESSTFAKRNHLAVRFIYFLMLL